jgi:hypothetical protein
MSPEARRGPISPSEAAELQAEQIPDAVFAAFNELIAQNLNEGRAVVMQRDVLALLRAQGIDRDEVMERRWLDIEGSYRTVGWQVKYDKPMRYADENFEPYFEFSSDQTSGQTTQSEDIV